MRVAGGSCGIWRLGEQEDSTAGKKDPPLGKGLWKPQEFCIDKGPPLTPTPRPPFREAWHSAAMTPGATEGGCLPSHPIRGNRQVLLDSCPSFGPWPRDVDSLAGPPVGLAVGLLRASLANFLAESLGELPAGREVILPLPRAAQGEWACPEATGVLWHPPSRCSLGARSVGAALV